MDGALDILEKRIDTITRILGPVEDNNTEPVTKGTAATENIVDSLLSAHTLLKDGLTGHEHIKKAIDRAPELEKYLDPNFLEDNQQVRSKEVYINAVAPELHTQFQQLEHIKALEPTLGAEYFRNIPSECTDKLKQYVEDNTEFAQQSELIEESLILAMKRYGEIQANLLGSLDQMCKRLDALEEKLAEKKKEELEKNLNEE